METIEETNHNQLLILINPLIDFMSENGYSFLLVAGKDETCTRHLRGNGDDIIGMLNGLASKNDQVLFILKESVGLT